MYNNLTDRQNKYLSKAEYVFFKNFTSGIILRLYIK